MCCGLPVLANRVAAIPESVIDGKTGLLVPPADAKRWQRRSTASRATLRLGSAFRLRPPLTLCTHFRSTG
jgi:hypothetical protein